MIEKEVIQNIKDRADIVEVISNYIEVIKNGDSYKALCPFHDDRDPSLSIKRDRNIYKCFSCNNSGDVFNFVKEYENINFEEAVCKVGELIGIPVKKNTYKNTKQIANKKYYDLLLEAIKYTNYNIKSEDGAKAIEYLKNRGINDKIIEEFKIGLVNQKNMLYNYLKGKGYSDEDIIAVDIAKNGNNGIYDTFRSRILFPIYDEYDNPLGFSGRTIINDSSKYINTAGTIIYKKSDVLFNYNKAKNHCRKDHKVYLVEGVLDVIALYRVGIENAVASLGTALTNQQISLLKKLGTKVIVAYDSDNAGLNATYKAIDLLLAANIEVEICKNDYNLDFDEVIDKYGNESLVKILNKHLSYSEFYIEYYKHKLNLNNHYEKQEFAKEIKALLPKIKDEIQKQHLIKEVYNLTNYNIDSTNYTSNSTNRYAIPVKKNISKFTPEIDGYEITEYELLRLMIFSKQAMLIFKQRNTCLKNNLYDDLSMKIIELYRKFDIVNFTDLLDKAENEDEIKIIKKIRDSNNIEYSESYCLSLIEKLSNRDLNEKLKEIEKMISKANCEEEKIKLYEEARILNIKKGRY